MPKLLKHALLQYKMFMVERTVDLVWKAECILGRVQGSSLFNLSSGRGKFPDQTQARILDITRIEHEEL